MIRFLKAVPTRTLVYAAILVALTIVFVFQQAGQPRRNALPVPSFDADAVSQVRISGPDGERTFTRNADAADSSDSSDTPVSAWLMGDENHPVAEGRIESLLEEISGLAGADIVTSRGNSEDYGLDDPSRRTIRIFTGNLEPVALQLGDPAAAGNAVYGRVNTSREIVLLPRTLDTAVSTDPMRFRDTTMVALPEDSIVEARILRPGRPEVVVERALDDGSAAEQSDGQSPWSARNPETGEPLEGDILNAFIRELRSLQASAFPEYLSDGDDPEGGSTTPEWTGDPVARIRVETADGESTEISLWPGDEEQVPARVSTNPYRFFIPRWRARRLMLNLE
jgi:hypothetical protein